MLLAEQELPGQVGQLNRIGISDSDHALRFGKVDLMLKLLGSNAQHSQVFQQFASKGTNTHHKRVQVMQFTHQMGAQTDNERFIRTNIDRFLIFLFEICHLVFGLVKDLETVEIEQLFQRQKLLSDGLDNLLTDKTAHERL